MVRPPAEQPSRRTAVLEERLRELRGRRDLTAADRRRLEAILREIGNLGGISLDDLLKPDKPDKPGGPNDDPIPVAGDFQGAEIEPAQIAKLIGKMAGDPPRGVDGLDFVIGSVLGQLRAERPETLPAKPVPSGRKGAVLPMSTAALGPLLQLAALRRTEGEASAVWDDGTNQLVVHAAKVSSAVTEGLVRICVPVECDQASGDMEIAFAVGSGARVAGMIMATADRPAGEPLIARVWGEALTAFAYGILLDLADSLAGASGRDERNDRLVPRGLVARRGQLRVETQARFAYDRSAK
ncbi:hypothetical protein GVY41_01280 [Frigidibacter albus]|uniref:Uncharacterized protein n=1 Tax=Frigidibacter albus TaxID=1465486 RepID=A0A6L8VBR7_9RHOB|nr:hypothetical protein [Frigidibacter albus]MZQ87725.1 hypothetical protein [Frigidibacter albus]NBE29631.1 hypothetical protein [Frigidibacter albus]GGH43678.1 hypothetical protein GCM10011341_02520 [Frigidibacter albus]